MRNSQLTERGLRTTATDLRIPKRKSNVGQKSFPYRGVKVWNSLPTDCKQISSLGKFKSVLHTDYLLLTFATYKF